MINFDTEGTFQLYDLAGQLDLPIHATRDITETVLGSADLIIFMFSNDSVQSLFDIEQWLTIIDSFFKGRKSEIFPEFILVNNKADLPSSVDPNLINGILEHDKRFLKYFKISCLSGMGIRELKKWLVDYCFIGECEDD